MKSKHNPKREASQEISAGNPPRHLKRLSIWDSPFTGNANFDAHFIASYGRRASRGVGVAPGARASRAFPHHKPRPRETEGRRTFPRSCEALRSPLQGGRGGDGFGVGGCGGFPTTIIAGADAGRGFHGTNVKSVSAAQVTRRVQGGEPWGVGFAVGLRRAVFSRAVSLVIPNNCIGCMGDPKC
jgi:hypothetical protein